MRTRYKALEPGGREVAIPAVGEHGDDWAVEPAARAPRAARRPRPCPAEPPTSRPSSRRRRPTIAKLSASEMRSAASITARSMHRGGAPAPMPSIGSRYRARRRRARPSRRAGAERIGQHDPRARAGAPQEAPDAGDRPAGAGARRRTRRCGRRSGRGSRDRSSARARSGFAGLQNWSARNQPCSAASRRATCWKLAGSSSAAFGRDLDARTRARPVTARLSGDIFSGITQTSAYPRAPATSASPMPVLPAVASTIVSPGRRARRGARRRARSRGRCDP